MDIFLITSLQGFKNKKLIKSKTWLVDVCEEKQAAFPTRTYINFQGESFTYGFVEKQANKIANLAQYEGWSCNDVVALFLPNKPSYIWICQGKMIKDNNCYISISIHRLR